MTSSFLKQISDFTWSAKKLFKMWRAGKGSTDGNFMLDNSVLLISVEKIKDFIDSSSRHVFDY